MWDITVEDVERIKKFFNVPDEIDEVLQPLIPEPIRATPTNDDFVAPATKSILDELLEEFRDEILNVTMVDEEADFNPTKDLEELEILLAKDIISPGRKAASEVYGVTSESLRRNHVGKVSEQKDTTKGTSVNTQFRKQSILGKLPFSSRSKLYSVTPFPKSKGLPKIDETHALSKPFTSNSVPTPQESKVMKNDNVIAPRMFRINPFKTSREEGFVPNKPIKASVRTNPITVSQPHSLTKKGVNSNSNGLSSTGVDNTTKTRRPEPRSNTKNDRVPSASKSSCSKNNEVEVEEHPRNLLLSTNKKHMSSECNNVKLAIRNDKFEVVCAMCKQCLIIANHDVCVLNYVNDMNSRDKKQNENVSKIANQKKQMPQVKKPKKFLGIICFGNDHVAAILGYGDLQWGNILITRVYFVEGLGHNLFTVGQFYDSDLEVAFRRNTCFVRNLEGIDLLKGNRTTNLYTINLYEMASASPIYLMARATSTKSWLWHQRLSHLNFDTINDLARNDLVTGLPKFKYHKEHLCPSCEKGKKQKGISPTQTSSKF
ncbi:retrovirus-related pol polyprotein from transposon TNT 1-94 [Tanacetum coccineum]